VSADGAATPAAGDLRGKVIGGLGWKLLSQIIAQGSRIAVGIVLAHLLTPRQFGVAAMALVFTGLASIFTDLSLGAALIQRAEITEEDRSTVFWTTIQAGAVTTAIGVAVAPLVGRLFGTPEVTPLFFAASFLALLSSIAATQMALLTREMNFRGLELREIAATVAGAVAAIAFALAGAGAWAIVAQSLVVAVVSVVLVWSFSSWRPRFIYSTRSLRTLGSFGIKTLFARLMSYLNLYADNLLVGKFLGSTALGVYTLAYNVMFVPANRIAQPVQQVLYAAFVRLQDDPVRLGRAWLRGNRLVTAINVPAFLGMAVVAPDFVPAVFGGRWHHAAPVLQLLSLAGVAQSFQTLNWSVLQSVGAPGRLLRFMIFSSVVTVGAFAAGLTWGVVGVAGLYAAARLVVGMAYTEITCRTIGLPVREFLRSIATPCLLAATMGAAIYAFRFALVEEGMPTGLRLVLLVVLGAGIYIGLLGWCAPGLLNEAQDVVRRRSYS
jgi:O-antigen/teichoic acid export membrane protein